MLENSNRLVNAIKELAAGINRETNFELIFKHYYQIVLKFFLGKSLEKEIAEELTQETFLRVYRNIETARFDYEIASFGKWLFTIAANLFVSRWRASRNFQAVSLDGALNPAGDETETSMAEFLPDARTESDAEKSAMASEFHKNLREALRQLPNMQQKCLTLYLLQERTAPEIARLLDLKEGTVKAHIHQAKENLKKFLVV